MNEEILNYFQLTEFPKTQAYESIRARVRSRYADLTDEEITEHEPYWRDLSEEMISFFAEMIKRTLPVR